MKKIGKIAIAMVIIMMLIFNCCYGVSQEKINEIYEYLCTKDEHNNAPIDQLTLNTREEAEVIAKVLDIYGAELERDSGGNLVIKDSNSDVYSVVDIITEIELGLQDIEDYRNNYGLGPEAPEGIKNFGSNAVEFIDGNPGYLEQIFYELADEQDIPLTPEEEEGRRPEELDIGESIKVNISSALDALFGILLYPLRLLIIALGGIFNLIITGIASIGGGNVSSVSLADIIYTTSSTKMHGPQYIPVVAIDFFEANSGSMNTIATGIANWFLAFRNLAVIISLCVLIYVGIRMAISSIAEDRAKYKNMLMNWVVQMVLIFVMQYLILFIMGINTALVGALTPGNINDNGNYENFMSTLFSKSFEPSMTEGFGAAIIYCILLGVTFSFLIMYIKRMLTIAFLIIISPLVTVTYAIDKLGDSRSQATNTWFKEYAYNVLIQPFHCIIYSVFVTTAISLLDAQSFGSAVLAIVCIMFMFKSEDILRKIFAFDKNAQSLGSGIASAAALGAGLQTVSSMFKKEQSSSKTNNANEPMPDLAAIHQRQAVQQAKENEEETNNAIQGAQNDAGVTTAAAIERQRRINRARERRNERGGAVGTALNVGKEYLSMNAKAALPVFSAFLGAGTGELSKMAGAGMAGYGIEKGIEHAASNLADKFGPNSKDASKIAQANERVFESIYKEFDSQMSEKDQKWKKMSDEEKINEVRKILNNKDVNSIQDKEVRDFAESAIAMNDTYKALGYNNPQGAVAETIRRVNAETEKVRREKAKNERSNSGQA